MEQGNVSRYWTKIFSPVRYKCINAATTFWPFDLEGKGNCGHTSELPDSYCTHATNVLSGGDQTWKLRNFGKLLIWKKGAGTFRSHFDPLYVCHVELFWLPLATTHSVGEVGIWSLRCFTHNGWRTVSELWGYIIISHQLALVVLSNYSFRDW